MVSIVVMCWGCWGSEVFSMVILLLVGCWLIGINLILCVCLVGWIIWVMVNSVMLISFWDMLCIKVFSRVGSSVVVSCG